MKNAAGLVAIAALVGTVFACSSKNEPGGTTGDGGAEGGGAGGAGSAGSRDAGRDRNIDTGEPGEAGTAGTAGTDSGPAEDDGTVGAACTADGDCEKKGADDKFCSNAGFTSGTLAPTPVCAGICRFDTTKPNSIQDCDGARGICLQAQGNQGVCLPACEWEDGGNVTGCTGKNKCEVYGSGKNTQTNKAVGVGICLGGCTADADCTGGDKCQIASGLCVKPANHKAAQDTATPGAICTGRNDTACSCLAPATGPGLCTRACVTGTATGAGSCPSGTVCSAGLEKTNTQGSMFTTQPAGIQGSCRKVCATDNDCNGNGATPAAGYCDTNDVVVTGTGDAGVTGVCTPGPKPAGGG